MTGKTPPGPKLRLKGKILNALHGPKKSNANGGGRRIKLVVKEVASDGARAPDSPDKE